MSAKSDVIAYVQGKFGGQDAMRAALISILEKCDDNGKLQALRTAYTQNDPEVEFTNDPNVDSGAAYDTNGNKLIIKPVGQPLDLADMFLFESFNCAHRKEYQDLSSKFNANTFPPMYFMDYGKGTSAIEGVVTYDYVTLLREVRQNAPDFALPSQAKRSLTLNEEVSHESQLVAKMTWTPHDPTGIGDWRFPTPEHYAFRKVMSLTPSQATLRVRHLVASAAGKNGYGAYMEMDPSSKFQKWWQPQWRALSAEHKPTAFIAVGLEANEVFKGKPGITWRPIQLADYQFNTAMEMEARRLLKRSPLGKAPEKW